MRIVVDRERCEGHAQCVQAAPTLFSLDDEDLSQVLRDSPADDERALAERAAQACPLRAIEVR